MDRREERVSRTRVSGNTSQCLQDGFVAGSLSVIDLNETPTNHAALVDHVGRRVRPAGTVRVEDPVSIDHPMVFVLEEGKVEVTRISFL